MTKEDTDRLFDLLALYRPGDRHLEDRQHRSLWQFTLEPYAPEDVKQAVGAYFRESKFWPDPTDITIRCPKPEQTSAKLASSDFDCHDWELSRPLVDRWDRLVKCRREAGLPGTIREAISAGISWQEWMDTLEEAGLAWST